MLLCVYWMWKYATVGLFTQVTKQLIKISLISLTFKIWMSRLSGLNHFKGRLQPSERQCTGMCGFDVELI